MRDYLRLYFRFSKEMIQYWDKLLILFIINNLYNLALLIAPLFLKVLFDYAYPYKDLSLLIFISTISFFLVLFFQLISNLSTLLTLYIDQRINQNLYQIVYGKLLKLPMRFFQENKTGDLIFKLTQDIEIIGQSIQNNSSVFLTNIIKIIVLLLIAMSINPKITLLALFGIPIHFLQTHFFAKKFRDLQQENQLLSANLYSILEERILNIKLIKIFNKGLNEIHLFLDQLFSLFVLERKTTITRSINTFFSGFIHQFWAFILALYTGYCVIQGSLTIGEVVAMTSYIGLLLAPFDKLFQLYTSFATAQVSFERISSILNCPNELDTSDIKLSSISGKIQFRNVYFEYDSNTPLLRELSFIIPAKTSVAIVGRSGSGKTSIIDLLLRFYDPQSGEILIDENPIPNISLSFLRNQVCLISQDVYLLSGTIRDNIAYGSNQSVRDADIITAAQLADAHTFINQQPNQYDTIISQNGQNLSGGQKQRIAIARALLANPSILIFDEATSALDSESEKYIQLTIERLKKTKTIIVIAHRLSCVKNVDQILVLGEDGSIVETGTFQELIQRRKIFYRMYEYQHGGYPIFIEQLRLLTKSANRYERPFSCALLTISNEADIINQIGIKRFSKLIEDIEIFFKINLREVDIGGYYHNQKILIAFPETNLTGAQSVCHRIKTEIENAKFDEIMPQKIYIDFKITEFHKEDTPDRIIERLN